MGRISGQQPMLFKVVWQQPVVFFRLGDIMKDGIMMHAAGKVVLWIDQKQVHMLRERESTELEEIQTDTTDSAFLIISSAVPPATFSGDF